MLEFSSTVLPAPSPYLICVSQDVEYFKIQYILTVVKVRLGSVFLLDFKKNIQKN